VQLASVEAATPAAVAPTVTRSPAAPAAPAVPDWAAVLDRLDRARAEAFARGDANALDLVYAPGSRLLAADRAAIARLSAAGQRARGVRHTTHAVTVTSYGAASAVLQVVDVLSAYELVDRTGRVVQRTAPRAEATFVVRLVQAAGGWRLAEVRPV
jgi:hypothetical protein